MSDILDEIEEVGSEIPQPKPQNNYGGGNNNYGGNGNYRKPKPKINMYDVDFIKALPFDTDSFSKEGKTFTVCFVPGDNEEENAKAKENIKKICKRLGELGFVMRIIFHANDKFENELCEIEGLKREVYLPYGKFNPKYAKESIIANYYEKPYGHAAEIIGKKFNESFSKPGKGIMASRAHCMLGKKSDNPVDFVIIYNEEGREFIPDKSNNNGGGKPERIDFKKLGNSAFYMKVAQKIGAQIFNVKKSESILQLRDLYLTKKDAE